MLLKSTNVCFLKYTTVHISSGLVTYMYSYVYQRSYMYVHMYIHTYVEWNPNGYLQVHSCGIILSCNCLRPNLVKKLVKKTNSGLLAIPRSSIRLAPSTPIA